MPITTTITDSKFNDLQTLINKQEALIFMGCGGALSEWTEGIIEELKDWVPPVLQLSLNYHVVLIK